MAGSFTKKEIQVTIVLGKGTFSEEGNTLIVKGLPTTVKVSKPGMPDSNKCSVTISGLSLDHMEQMTTLSWEHQKYMKNTIQVEAGEEGGSLTSIFKGHIVTAYADFNSSPEIEMKIEAETNMWGRLIPQSPVAVNGTQGGADLIKQFAGSCGMNFRNDGNVTGSMSNCVIQGSPIQKAEKVADAMGAELIIDDNTMILTKRNGIRKGEAVVLSPETGMIGYPTFSSNGISVKCIFNPLLNYFSMVEIKSVVPKASGLWRVSKMEHSLSAYGTSGGDWTTSIEATKGYTGMKY